MSDTALVDAAVIALVQDPMHRLTAAERTLLRKLGSKGPALSIGFRKGWMLDGTRYTDAAMSRFLSLRLARFWRDGDGVKIGLNDMGQLAAWKLSPIGTVGAEPPPDDD